MNDDDDLPLILPKDLNVVGKRVSTGVGRALQFYEHRVVEDREKVKDIRRLAPGTLDRIVDALEGDS